MPFTQKSLVNSQSDNFFLSSLSVGFCGASDDGDWSGVVRNSGGGAGST